MTSAVSVPPAGALEQMAAVRSSGDLVAGDAMAGMKAGPAVSSRGIDEAARLAAVRRYDILDSPPDGTFDRICSVAAQVFDAPMAVVSIVDEDRIWFLSRHGLDLDQVRRDPGLCASAILRDEITVLPDTVLDPEAVTNPLVAGELGLRFYVAAPIRTSDGHNLGTLCVLDRQPRPVTASETAVLQELAAVVADQLELRLATRTLMAYESELHRVGVEAQQRNERFADALRATLRPAHLPAVPGIDLAALYRPADRSIFGGDFYDIFPLGRGAWGITIGDVCGKGVDAALIAASARHAVRAGAVEHQAPSQVLSVVNGALLIDVATRGVPRPPGGALPHALENRFCTVAYARLRPYRDGFRLTTAHGGHPLPFLRTASGRVEDLGRSGTLLGALVDAPCPDQSTFLRPGDTVLWFTDGLSEAPTAAGLFSRDSIREALRPTQTSAAAIIEHLDEALSSRAVRQRDDIAVVALRVTACPPINRKERPWCSAGECSDQPG